MNSAGLSGGLEMTVDVSLPDLDVGVETAGRAVVCIHLALPLPGRDLETVRFAGATTNVRHTERPELPNVDDGAHHDDHIQRGEN